MGGAGGCAGQGRVRRGLRGPAPGERERLVRGEVTPRQVSSVGGRGVSG